MSDFEHRDPSSGVSPTAPPTEPLDVFPDAPAVWPKVVGIISIVFGALAVTCNGASAIVMPFMGPIMAGANNTGPLPPSMQFNALQWGAVGLSVAVNIVLIIAGIVTALRMPAGRALHLVYAVLGIVMAGLAVWIGLGQQADMAQWVKDNPGSPFAQQHNPVFEMIGLGLGLGIALLWPLFCLIWFGMVKRTHESMGPQTAA